MILYSQIPTLDMHGFDRDYARVMINDFIRDQHTLKVKKVIIVHGIGTGILRKTTSQVLKKNKFVKDYKLDNFNSGQTLVDLCD